MLEEKLIRLKKINRIQSKIVYREIDEEDWAGSWKTYFWPEKIGERVVIKPTWRKYIADPGDIIIEIDLGMA
ncbi:MAG TPA: 50S ribosomal protein L11 methyltransferase, partial [Desulfobacterales bacterium]|nr:50S ribosomal protein L11 methyltransferase [Desulfobacterales bacterium]